MRNRTGGAAEVAVSETGGAYNSGQRGTTDAFASCFWWADLLGSLAKHEHAMGCRQALVGGRYALVDLTAGRRGLAPDFYLLLLWRQLMSPKVLRVRASASARVRATATATARARGYPNPSPNPKVP